VAAATITRKNRIALTRHTITQLTTAVEDFKTETGHYPVGAVKAVLGDPDDFLAANGDVLASYLEEPNDVRSFPTTPADAPDKYASALLYVQLVQVEASRRVIEKGGEIRTPMRPRELIYFADAWEQPIQYIDPAMLNLWDPGTLSGKQPDIYDLWSRHVRNANYTPVFVSAGPDEKMGYDWGNDEYNQAEVEDNIWSDEKE